jgi:hypothetical protein
VSKNSRKNAAVTKTGESIHIAFLSFKRRPVAAANQNFQISGITARFLLRIAVTATSCGSVSCAGSRVAGSGTGVSIASCVHRTRVTCSRTCVSRTGTCIHIAGRVGICIHVGR